MRTLSLMPCGDRSIFKGNTYEPVKLWISSHNLTHSLRPLYPSSYIITGGENAKLETIH